MTYEVVQGHELGLQLASGKSPEDETRSDTSSWSVPSESIHALAQDMREARMQRQTHFKPALFSDPAWDILLDLFLAECDGRRLSITGAAYSADIPPTTALRWISALEQEGLVRRENDPLDKRRTHVQLTDLGLQKMHHYFQSRERRAHTSGTQYALSHVLTKTRLRA